MQQKMRMCVAEVSRRGVNEDSGEESAGEDERGQMSEVEWAECRVLGGC